MNEHRLIAIKACIDNGLTSELSEKTISEMYNEIERLRGALEDVERDQAYDGTNTLDIVRQALEGGTK